MTRQTVLTRLSHSLGAPSPELGEGKETSPPTPLSNKWRGGKDDGIRARP